MDRGNGTETRSKRNENVGINTEQARDEASEIEMGLPHKSDATGKTGQYKARLVAVGTSQVEGVGYFHLP